MHQDQRIGLALGVLLLGAAGAFFFRNDSAPVSDTPRLRTGKQLDARIAEKAVSPYLQGIEELEEAPGRNARPVSDINGPSLFSGNNSRGTSSTDPFGDEDHEPFSSNSRSSRSGTGTIRGEDGIPDLAPIPIPDSEEIGAIASPQEEQFSSPTSTNDRFHVVQKGETLSAIAAKTLGSTNRFIELFEANRDQLKDANDLRVGMKLRIPDRKSTSKPRATVTTVAPDLLSDSAPPLIETPANQNSKSSLHEARPSGSPSTHGESQGGKSTLGEEAPSSSNKKFVTPKRLPLGTRLPGPQTDATDAKSQAGRRLSQLPPDDINGQIAR